MLRFFRYAVEFIAAFIGFVILLAFLLAWRLSAHPMASNFLTPYIETAIENLVPDSKVHAGGSLLTWDNIDRSINIHIDDVKIDDIDGGEIGMVPSIDAKISLFGFLFGQFLPKDLAIDHPQLKLERNKDGAFVFGGMAMSGGGQKRPFKDIVRSVTEHMSHAVLMHKLAVTRAVFDVHDDITEKDWAVSMPEISVTRKILEESDRRLDYGALDGRLLFAVTQKDTTATLDVQYAYDPLNIRHTLSTSFDGLNPAWLAGGHPETLGLGIAAGADLPLSGKATVTLDKSMAVENAAVQIHGDEGRITYPDFWNDPRPIKSVDMQVDFDRAARKLSVSDTHIDFGGPTIDLDVTGAASAKAGQDMDYTAVLKVDGLPMNDFDAFWPKPVIPDARSWLAANLRDGTYSHAEATLNGSFAWQKLDDLSIDSGEGTVQASNGRVTYLDGMPPASGVNAEAHFTLKDMLVQITSGGIGAIRMSPFTIRITGLADPDQYIDVPLQVGGPVPEILQLLDHKPLGYAKKLGVTPEDIQGNIEGTVKFHFPLLKTLQIADVAINADASATNIASTRLVPGAMIDQGNVELVLDMSGFSLKGQADINKIPFQVMWKQNFEEKKGEPLQQAMLNGVVRDDQWSNLGVTAFNGSKGPVNVTFQLLRPTKNRSQLLTSLDMTGAAINVDMLNWKKPANAPAILKLSADAVTGQPVQVTAIDLHGDQIAASGKAVLSPDMTQLLSVDMSRLMVGRTNAAIHFRQSFGKDGSVHLDAVGKSLDISGFRGDDAASQTDLRPKDFQVKLDRLYTSPTGEIDMAQGSASRDNDGWNIIDFNGVVGGGTAGEGKPLSLELTPQPDGHRVLSITCDDFGDAMKGLGFTDTIKGGKLSVTGQSTAENPRQINGAAQIAAFSVGDLPVLALLINATSPFGFSGLITGTADFSRFEGEFTWQGDELTLTHAHAAGSALGINVDGKINMNSGDANLQGTLVPFSTVNKILSFIPLLGDLLTGGQDQGVLAVSYTIKGPLNKPQISVNPVSLLTPGFLRNLFFRDDMNDMTP